MAARRRQKLKLMKWKKQIEIKRDGGTSYGHALSPRVIGRIYWLSGHESLLEVHGISHEISNLTFITVAKIEVVLFKLLYTQLLNEELL